MQAHFTRLIRALASRLGQESPADEAETRFFFDFENCPLLIEHLAAPRQLLLAAPVAELPEGNRAALAMALLKGQHLFHKTAGATLSVDPNERFVGLAVAKELEILTPENFPGLVENFLQVADTWREFVEGFAAGMPAIDAPAAPGLEAFNPALMMLRA
jgi:hypothetical protein